MEKFLGRKLDFNEIVHHIDGNKLNNDIKNLKIISREEHTSFHQTGLKKKGNYNPYNKIDDDKIKAILKYHKKGFSYRKIAKIVKVSNNTVRLYCIKYCIK